ncbi:hypothetical protein F4781DRAFT_439608 [Annulohypoxylon bovei var. microspora]|nr:hypothetical protein F4781DRAFT_439608 [Annulohypoxylon bovei var. microspora]
MTSQPKTPGRLKRANSQLGHEMSQQDHCNSDGEFYLPGGKGIFVTTTKKGKPALGRKKKDRLLEDFGFDILGSAFGIPSRIDFEREAEREACRRKSFTTQRSTPTTPLALAPPTTPRGRFTKHHGRHKRGGSLIAISKRGPGPTSTPTRIRRGTGSLSSGSSYDRLPEARDGYLTPGYFYPPANPTPVSSPMWNLGNSMAISPNHGFPTTPPAGIAYSSGILPWAQSAPLMVPSPHYVQSPIHPISQSASAPLSSHQSQPMTPYHEIRSSVYPIPGSFSAYAPPLLSPLTALPLSANQPRDEPGTTALNSPFPLRYSPSEAKKCEEHYSETLKSTTPEAGKHEDNDESKGEKTKEAKRDIGKHIQHIHCCAGCGKVRSRQYQKAHPLKRGQIPDRDYCVKCQREAALAESDDTGDTVVNNSNEDPILTTTTDAPRTRYSKKQNGTNTCGTCKQTKKSKCFDSLSSILTNSTVSEGHTMLPLSVTSTEESDVRVSASIRGSGAGSRAGRHRSMRQRSLVRETVHKMDSDGDAPPLNIRSPRSPQGIHPWENKEATLGEYVGIKNSSSVADMEGVSSKESVSGPRSNNVLGNTPANNTGASSRVSAREKGSRFSEQSSSELLPKIRPRVSLQSISDHPEVVSPYYDGHNKMTMSMDEDYYYPTIGKETSKTPKATYSNVCYNNSRSRQPTSRAYGLAHEYKSTCESMSDARVHGPQTHSSASSRYGRSILESELGQQERSHRRRVRRHRDDTGLYRNRPEERYMDNMLDTEQENPDYVSGWDLPPTPPDLSHAYSFTYPYFTDEPWNSSQEGQGEFGQEIESVAEEDLASAAKFFNSMTSPVGDPSAPLFHMPSFTTRTEISVESYYPGEELDGPNLPLAAYELYEASDSSSMVGQEGSQVKTLEYSSKDDRNKRTAVRASSGASSTHHPQQKLRGSKHKSLKQCEENTYHSEEIVSSSSPGPASSMIVHTGHSAEGLQSDSIDDTNLTVVGKRRRIRQMLGL